jgi:hypothetical protein
MVMYLKMSRAKKDRAWDEQMSKTQRATFWREAIERGKHTNLGGQ